jgi:hypothetical protein
MITDDLTSPGESGKRTRFSLSEDGRRIIARSESSGGCAFILSEPGDAAALVILLNSLDVFSDRMSLLLSSREVQVEAYIRRNIKLEKTFNRHALAVAEALSFYRDSGIALKSSRASEVFDLLLFSLDDLETEFRKSIRNNE